MNEPETLQPPPRWVHRLAVGAACLTFVLICAGGIVKGLEAGLSVPDWPLSFGQPKLGIVIALASAALILFAAWVVLRKRALAVGAVLTGLALASTYYLFGPAPQWYKMPNVNAEHSHRLIAGTVGLLTFVLAGALWQTDGRRWVKRLVAAALASVILQAVLGGLTVKFLLPPWISAAHGSLAQVFFAMLVMLAIVTSPRWFEARAPLPHPERKSFQRMSVLLLAALLLQVLLGAAVRHTSYHANLANQGMTFWWHLGAHLAGVLFVLHAAASVIVRVIRRFGDELLFARPAKWIAGLLGVQVLLGVGALIYRLTTRFGVYERDAVRLAVTTAHVAVASLLIAAAVWIALHAFRRVARPSPQATPKGSSAEADEPALASTGGAA